MIGVEAYAEKAQRKKWADPSRNDDHAQADIVHTLTNEPRRASAIETATTRDEASTSERQSELTA